jgi:hypothetical protein
MPLRDVFCDATSLADLTLEVEILFAAVIELSFGRKIPHITGPT